MALLSSPSLTNLPTKTGSHLRLAYNFTPNDLLYNRSLRLSPRQVRRPFLKSLQLLVLGGLILLALDEIGSWLPFTPTQGHWAEALPLFLVATSWLIWRCGDMISMFFTIVMGLEKAEGILIKETDIEQDNLTAIMQYYGSVGDITLSLTLPQFHALRTGQKYRVYLACPFHTVLSIEAI